MDPKIDAFLANAKQWGKEMKAMRAIALDCGLTEELKWGKPCYSFEGKNIVIIQGFKAYCAFMFFKGYLLKNPDGILVKTGPNTRVGRQIRFTDGREIAKQEKAIKACIYQAIEVEKASLQKPSGTSIKSLAKKTARSAAKKPAKKPSLR